MYPFILMYGIYIVINGADTPGGGFQGGAVLFAVFISRYLSFPVYDIKTTVLRKLEEILFALIIILPVIFIFYKLNTRYPFLNTYYLAVMNLLIGVKVCFGLAIIFFRFIFFESR
jgi:multicomponent Na+:H+ antiporter subunit B